MLPPLPRCSGWAYSSLISPSRISLPRKGCRVGLHIVLFEACSAFTRVAACTLALSPIRDTLIEGFSHFVTSMTAPIASGWSGCRVGLAPTGKRRLCTAHANNGSPDSRVRVRPTCQWARTCAPISYLPGSNFAIVSASSRKVAVQDPGAWTHSPPHCATAHTSSPSCRRGCDEGSRRRSPAPG